MLFRNFNFDDKKFVKKFTLNAGKHSATWEHYYACYNYALEKIFQKALKESYGFNYRARSLMFLIRHSFELCLKYNLFLKGNTVPINHSFLELTSKFASREIPVGLVNCIKEVDHDKDGACYRYYRNSETKKAYFSYQDQISLSEPLRSYNAIRRRGNFKHGKICPKFDYDNRMIQWALTLHIGGHYTLGQIRTQYDETIELLIEGILMHRFDLNRLFLPLLFLIRHSLELALKGNIIEVQSVSNLIKPNNIEQEHSLARLYNIYSDFLDKVDMKKLQSSTQDQLKQYRERYRELNDALHMLDHNSRYFRYPVDKDGKPHRFGFSKISLIEILKLYYFTDPFVTFTNYVLEDNGVIERLND